VDAFARLPAEERADYFRETASRMGLGAPLIVEKDFWVCWTLLHVFSLEGQPRIVFKGGTSLSKCYGAIQRFSEDIDLAFHREDLGAVGDSDPARAPGRKARERLLDGLEQRRATLVAGGFREALLGRFEATIEAGGWGLEVDTSDPQTLLFRYPLSLSDGEYGGLAYVTPTVRLELGARSDHEPAEDRVVRPYLAEEFPDAIASPDCPDRVLTAERTFWEKATLLHAEAHRSEPARSSAERRSRHYYDVVMLWRCGVGRRALTRLELLAVVAEHKRVYFASTAAHYETARAGSLRLVPEGEVLAGLRRDYAQMDELLFGEPPTFDELVDELRAIEKAINGAG
jgi:nucleotidyltransferase AbiEii toxin of type IV toxin-antitoxin system